MEPVAQYGVRGQQPALSGARLFTGDVPEQACRGLGGTAAANRGVARLVLDGQELCQYEYGDGIRQQHDDFFFVAGNESAVDYNVQRQLLQLIVEKLVGVNRQHRRPFERLQLVVGRLTVARVSGRETVFRIASEPAAERAARVEELRKLGFTWADLDGQPYWIDQLVTINAATHERLERAAAQLWAVFDKTARFVHGRRDLYALLSIPEVLWDGLDRLPLSEPGRLSRYARFDFSVSPCGDVKLLELNADTPTAYVEAAVATPWLCAQHARDGVRSVNGRMAELVRRAWSAEKPEAACCAGYGTHLEDSGTIDMLVRHSGRDMRCVDTLSLSIEDGVLKDGNGDPIGRIFMLYPKEWMGIDDGGEALAYAAETGSVVIANSYHAVLLQSKGLQAVIWGLHEIGAAMFSPAEHEAIEAYMLPTYNEPVLPGDYVSKAMFGREGGSVELYDAEGRLDAKDMDGYDTSRWFRRVYQMRADLPEVRLHAGPMRLLTGIFVIDGEPCGIVGRAGGLITGNASHFVAMGVRE